MDNVIRGLLHAWNGDFANFRDAIQKELLMRAAACIEDLKPVVAQSMFEDCEVYHSNGVGDVPFKWSTVDNVDRVHDWKLNDLPDGYELHFGMPEKYAGQEDH